MISSNEICIPIECYYFAQLIIKLGEIYKSTDPTFIIRTEDYQRISNILRTLPCEIAQDFMDHNKPLSFSPLINLV